jgi:cholesterol oxidase
MRIPRRTFLEGVAGAVGGISLGGCTSRHNARGQSHQEGRAPKDALIIGSGFGGSIAAYRLAEIGVPTIVLERGRRWEVRDDESTFTSVIEPDRRAAWFRTDVPLPGAPGGPIERYAGILERFETDPIDVIRAAGVGGGSLVFGGIMIQPPADLFRSVFPEDVLWEEMDGIYYPRVRRMMHVARVPDDILAHERYLSTRVFLDQAERAGLDVTLIENAINWDRIRDELTGVKRPAAIWGDYNYGLNSGAKYSLDRTYLAEAETSGLVDVRPLHRVLRIGASTEGGYWAECERIDELGNVLETLTLRAESLFLGAGSLGTTELLSRARAEGTLPDLSSEVGESWGNNGQHIFLRRDVGTETGTYQGGPPTAFIRHSDNAIGPVSIENGPGPFPIECGCLISIGHGMAPANGRLQWDGDAARLRVDFDPADTALAVESARETCRILNDANSGTVELFGTDKIHTYHPLGGACMGRACDTHGRVLGYTALYVVDGALIPGLCPTVNPALTIAAIAERCMSAIASEDFA